MVMQGDTAWESRVDALIRDGRLRTPRIIHAFRALPRSVFLRDDMRQESAVDQALSIGGGQTISQPTTVAVMLEAVQPELGDTVLDIGTGSGWQAALLAHIVGPEGAVYTIERVRELASAAQERFRSLRLLNIQSFVGDATKGLPAFAPFDVIIAAAEAPDVPAAFLRQLALHGRLLQPITDMGLRVITKDDREHTQTRDIPGFVFVPLVSSGEDPKGMQ